MGDEAIAFVAGLATFEKTRQLVTGQAIVGTRHRGDLQFLNTSMTPRGYDRDKSLHGHEKLAEAPVTRPHLEMKRAGDLAHGATVQEPHLQKNPLLRAQFG